MAWIFSKALMDRYSISPCLPAQAAEYSADSCLAGELYVPSSATSTPPARSWQGKTTDASIRFRSGMTFALSTEQRGADVLTSFLEAFPVRTSAPQEREQESTASEADSGPKWPASLAKYDQGSRSWKTRQCLLHGGLAEFSATWPKWGMTRGGALYQLPMPSGLAAIRLYITNVVACGSSERVPTPTVCGNYNRKGASKTSGDGLATYVKKTPEKVATPTARDWKSGKASQATMERNSRPLSEQVGGNLNPQWVEWLMGWPIGWTEQSALETDKFRQWRRSHGEF